MQILRIQTLLPSLVSCREDVSLAYRRPLGGCLWNRLTEFRMYYASDTHKGVTVEVLPDSSLTLPFLYLINMVLMRLRF